MSINIPRSVIDPFYRYKMPKPTLMYTGKGKNTKTIVQNFEAICKALDRQTDELTKYYKSKLGTSASFRKEGFIIKGEILLSQFDQILDIFIFKYVLCDECGNPETYYVSNGKSLICKACGHKSKIK